MPKFNDCEVDPPKNHVIQSPHFYKPQKNKLFYIPKANIMNKGNCGKQEKPGSEWVQETINDQIQEYLSTEGNLPSSHTGLLKQITSPKDRINHKILSTKNTTEETDEYNKGGLRDITFENALKAARKVSKDKEVLNTCENLQLEQNGSSSTIQRDNMPSVKEIKENSSHSTIDKIHPNDLMEDSMNTCSVNKDSGKKRYEKPKYASNPKQDGFISTLANAITYFEQPKQKPSKSKEIKSRATTYLSALTSPTVVGRSKAISQIPSKKANKLPPNNNVLYTKSMFKKLVTDTNFAKFTTDKVLKTENDAILDDQMFCLTGILIQISLKIINFISIGEVKDSMEEDIVEDSMNKDADDAEILRTRVQQLECEVIKLHRVIKDEKNKNNELELTLNYFQQLYKKEKSDKTEAQTAFNRVLGSFCLSDQTSASNGRKSEEFSYHLSPKSQITKNINQKRSNTKNGKKAVSRSKERHTSIENHMTFRKVQNQSCIQSPKMLLKKSAKQMRQSVEDDKKRRLKKTKSRKEDKRSMMCKLNQSMNSPNLYNQMTQETQSSKIDDLSSTAIMETF